MHIILWLGNLEGGDHSEELGIDGKINIRMYLRETEWKGVDWMHRAQAGDQWRALVSTIMKLWVPYKAGSFLPI
jgi:hypothetical protein